MIEILNIYITDNDDLGYNHKFEIPCTIGSLTTVYKVIKNFIKDDTRKYIKINRTQKRDECVSTIIINPSDTAEAIRLLAIYYQEVLRTINLMNEYYEILREEGKEEKC